MPAPMSVAAAEDGGGDGCVETFSIRHMKAGRTGARKTWSAAPILLDYLTLQNGLQSLEDKNVEEAGSVLNMALNTTTKSCDISGISQSISQSSDDKQYNILELGGGSGYVSVGLAKSVSSSPKKSHSSNMKIMCTDMDRETIKNMRHNICANKETKIIAIEKLDWGSDIGGIKFAKALERKFNAVKSKSKSEEKGDDDCYCPDPIKLLTHVIGSDVHFGVATLDPLSSIISSIKVRNPNVQVIIMNRERSSNSVAELVEQIELKVNQKMNGNELIHHGGDGGGFTVHVRDVIQAGDPGLNMKLVEC